MTSTPLRDPNASDQQLFLWVRSMAASLRAINEEQQLSHILDLIAEHACSLLDLRWCTVYTLDDETQVFTMDGAHGIAEHYEMSKARSYPLRLSDGGAGHGPPTVQAAVTKQTVIVDDVFERVDLEPWLPVLRREGLRAIIATPLHGSDASIIGTITGYAETGHAFDSARVAQLDLLSDHAAAAIVAARRRDREREAIAALEDANAELLRQQEVLAAHRALQHELIELILKNAGLARIVTFLSERLHAGVYLETIEGMAIAEAGWSRTADAIESIASVRAKRIQTVMDSGQAAEVLVTGSDSLVLAPIPRTGSQHLRMWVRRPRAFALDDGTVRALAACAVLIALEYSRKEIQAHAEARIVRDLLADLLSPATMGHPESFARRAKALGHNPHHAHTAVVIAPVTDAAKAASDTDIARTYVRLIEANRNSQPRPVIGGLGGTIVALVPTGSSDPAVDVFVELARNVMSDDFRLVVGGSTPSLAEMPSELNLTLRAATLLTPNSPSVVSIAQLGIPALLLEAGTTDRLTSFADQILGPVLRDDPTKSGDLMSTLQTWFGCDMSSRETARQLFVHPNTIGYRLRRIGELIGLRMNDPGDLMTIRLALNVLQLQGRCPPPHHSAP